MCSVKILVEGAARKINILRLSIVWHKCRAHQTQADSQLLRLEEDANKVLEMAIAAFTEMRAVSVAEHPDVLVTDCREPHKRFLTPCLSIYLATFDYGVIRPSCDQACASVALYFEV